MNTKDFFIKRFGDEKPVFLRVFAAVPGDQIGYKPHERSMSAGDLLWLLAFELKDACTVVENGEVHFQMPKAPSSKEEIVAEYEKNAGHLQSCVSGLGDEAWDKPVRFLVEGNVAWEAPLGEMLWGFLFDAIHHRGQLSTYIRPMGGKVPSIYGPSGDDPGM